MFNNLINDCSGTVPLLNWIDGSNADYVPTYYNCTFEFFHNLKFGDVTAGRSPTFSDSQYVKKIIFSLDYYFLSMFSISFVVLFNTVYHLLMSYHNFSLFIQVPYILFYGDLLTLKTHHYKPNSMNSMNLMNELWKNSITSFSDLGGS